MWHDRRAAVLPVARVAAVLLGAAVVLGYVTAGDGGAVAPKSSAPASTLEPASGGTLRLRDVAIPEQLKAPPRRPQKKQQQQQQESNQTENQTPAQPTPSRPSGSGGGFDSVG